MNPKIHLTAFKDRIGKFIFVAVPDECGRYVRTTRDVALVSCPDCKAIKGEPCKSKHGYGGTTHVARRVACKRAFGRLPDADDCIHPRTGTPVKPLPEEQEWA